MEESQKEEEEELCEEEELKELDLAATQVLDFLGQSYVTLSGFHAVEEFLCEQYAASTRFLVRCLSGSSSLSNTALSCEPLRSRKNPAQSTSGQSIPETERISVQRNSRLTDLQTDQITVLEGGLDSDDGRALKFIESLCVSIDSVLTKARKVREKSTTTGTKVGFFSVCMCSLRTSQAYLELPASQQSAMRKAMRSKSVVCGWSSLAKAEQGNFFRKEASRIQFDSVGTTMLLHNENNIPHDKEGLQQCKASKPSGKGGVSFVTPSDDGRAATANNATSKTILIANPRENTKKSPPREINNGRRKAAKSRRPSSRTVQASSDLGDSRKEIRKMSESMKECQSPETNSNLSERSSNKLADESTPTGKKTGARFRLKLPEKLRNLLAWFETRGISLDDPLYIPRAEAQTAKENFLSVLNEVNRQQDYSNHKDSREAASRVEETQGVLKQLASHVSPFEMGLLLRVAPAGSPIAQQRDSGIQKVLRTQSQQGATAPNPAKCQVTYSGALTPLRRQLKTFSWLPQDCWPYFGQALDSLRGGGDNEFDAAQMLKRTYTRYTDLEVALLKCFDFGHEVHKH